MPARVALREQNAAQRRAGGVDGQQLLTALAAPDALFILGAGASAPDVPTIRQIPDRLAPFASQLNSFPAGPLPDSPLRRLIAPLIDRATKATDIASVWPGLMTAGTVAVLLEEIIARSHRRRLTQYEVFRLFSVSASVVSFNWDGLAEARCPQRTRIHPHGRVPPRPLVPEGFAEALDFSQEDDTGWLRDYLMPGVVMLGEEDRREHDAIREQVFQLWRLAGVIVVVGYSFGLGSGYDRAWLNAFVSAMNERPSLAIHLVDPNADQLRAELGDEIGELRVFAWPYSWQALSGAILDVAAESSALSVMHMLDRWQHIARHIDGGE